MQLSDLAWLMIIPLASAPFVYLAGRLTSRSFHFHSRHNISRWLALAAVTAAFIPATRIYQSMRTAKEIGIHESMVQFQFDGISLLVTFATLALGFLVILFTGPYLDREEGEEKFYSLLLILIGSIIGLGCASDLFNLWVWFEVMAISTYTLVAFYREQAGALEAGVKYLVQSAFGSVFVVLGVALVFGQTGTVDLTQIKAGLFDTPVLLVAGGLFIVGFGVKAAFVPLHTWLPDAHSQAPSGISAMLSGVVIEAGLVAMLRVIGALAHISTTWGGLFIGLGAVNMLAGNLMALRQSQVKRMLAYSSISHVGYMLTGIGIAIQFKLVEGADGAMFHLVNHAAMKGLAFLAAGALLYALIIRHGQHRPLEVDDLQGASLRYPLEALTLSVALLALGGLPPLSGFMSKWVIFTAGFKSGQPLIYAAVLFMAANSVLSLGYYAPVINRLYRQQASAAVEAGVKVPFLLKLPLVLLALVIIVAGFYPGLMSGLYEAAGRSFMALFL